MVFTLWLKSPLQLISRNQQAFIDILNSPSSPEGGAGSGGAPGELPQGMAPQVIQVTPQEKEAIDRVSAKEHFVCVL